MSEQQFYENYWQNATNNYGGMLDSPPQWTTEQINSHLKDFEPFIGEKTLDVGCGEGVFTEALSTITNSTGLEISQEAINRGEKRNSSLKLMQGDLNNIPFEANMFDSLTMIEVIEHLVDVKQSVSECYRVLKPGGHLIITTTDFNWPKKLIIAAFFWDKFFFPYNYLIS